MMQTGGSVFVSFYVKINNQLSGFADVDQLIVLGELPASRHKLKKAEAPGPQNVEALPHTLNPVVQACPKSSAC